MACNANDRRDVRSAVMCEGWESVHHAHRSDHVMQHLLFAGG